MRLMSTETVAIVAVLLVVSLSAGAAMVFGDVADDRDDDKEKDTSSVGGGSLGTVEQGRGPRIQSHDSLDATAGGGRLGGVLPAEGALAEGRAFLARHGDMPVLPPTAFVPERYQSRPTADVGPDDGDDQAPAPPVPDRRVSVVIPEPATLSLLSVGGLGLLVRHRRRC